MSLRTKLLLPLGLFFSAISAAQATTLEQALTECRAKDNVIERLACYDAIDLSPLANKKPMPERMDKSVTEIAEQRRQQVKPVQPAPAPAPTQPVEPAVKPKPESQFGLQVKSEVDEIEDISDTIADITKTIRGKQVIHMVSGAVWQQVDSRYFKLKKDMDVYIERGSLGSFYLGHDGVNGRIKVKRIK